MQVVSVEQMRAIEKEADERGVSFAEMMERAGRGVAEVVVSEYGDEDWRVVTALVGSGNNGGDALVALETLARSGWTAQAYLVRPRDEKDPLLERARTAGVLVMAAAQDKKLHGLQEWLENSNVLLDGVLGTGIQLPLKEEIAAILKYVSEAETVPHVVAIDCPSGVDCNTGEAAAETIPAELTLCMQAVKQGLLRFPAFEKVGELRVVNLELPEKLASLKKIDEFMVDGEQVAGYLPERPMTAHKGTFGTLMIAAGSTYYIGAPLLAARGAYRMGVGLVRLAVAAPLQASLAGQFPEATWLLLPDEMGMIAEGGAEVLRKNLSRVTAFLVGPGLGAEETTASFIKNLLTSAETPHQAPSFGFLTSQEEGEVESGESPKLPPLVMDADGLRLMARVDGWPELLPPGSVLTPHPGEMSALTGLEVAEIQANRQEVACKFAKKWKTTVILKGALTVIAAEDGRAYIIPVASAALAKAGSGDVLAGIVAGLLAQGRPALEAAVAGAWIHAQAGLEAADQLGGTAPVLASDVIEAIPRVLWALRFE
ncbi:NAD(P)H-hydrate dehydratase [Longilinea arvoryzae]|nr:NAD(P)H-hydrate dehydratase [Longilinea arvoryzae]